MPAQRPCAAFEPISPDLDLSELVESTPNFDFVVRIHWSAIEDQGLERFEKLVLLHVILGGKPLVIEEYNERLEGWIFAVQWLRDNFASKVENARNLTTKSNLPLSIGHYLNNMALLTDQWNSHNYKDTNRQRIYLKDIDCPQTWHEKLKDLIPPVLFYLNESTGDIGGPGAVHDSGPHTAGARAGKGVSKAGDLMSSLPPEMRAENLMCYIGHEGTYTPSHREMCASLGHNIMVESSTGQVEDGKPTKPGSSIWFMTETKDRHLVSEYWLSKLGHDIEIEQHFAQINAWKSAPFKTYVVDQRVGDFILIPPLAPHQVWNRGTRTMKVAWNRTTVETLEMAISEALPRARMVCRDEQYKNKAVVYYTLKKYSDLLDRADGQGLKTLKVRQLQKDFKRLFSLYTTILLSESFSRDLPEPRNMDLLPFDSNVTCAYCRCNIFNRFLTCPSCVGKLPNGEDDNYDICMECYAMGRSCACISKLKWVEQFKWKELSQAHEAWKNQIIQLEGKIDDQSPRSLPVAQETLGRKTLAAVCQEELKRRPWTDITKPRVREVDDSEEVDVDDEGRVRKRRKIRRSEKSPKKFASCHICKGRESAWKLAACSSCGVSYCYGSLFRGFDMMPQTIMENIDWKCPKCQKICTCGACRRDPSMKPFEPTGTLLGHDTKKIADPRSVESLVDFSHSNIRWLKKAGDDHPHDTRRLRKRQAEAEKAKSRDPALNEHYVESTDPVHGSGTAPTPAEYDGIPIDPALGWNDQEDSGLDNHQPQDLYTSPTSTPYAPRLPEFTVPENAVFRDEMEDEYEQNEAITFEYPDPDILHVPNSQPLKATENTLNLSFSGVGEPTLDLTNGEPRGFSQTKKSKNGFNMSFDGTADVPMDPTMFQPRKDGKSLIVKFKVDREALSRVAEQSVSYLKPAKGATAGVAILRSDLTPVDPLLTTSLTHTKSRRVSTREMDADFAPRKNQPAKGSNSASRRKRQSNPDAVDTSGQELGDVDIAPPTPVKRNPPRVTKQRNHANAGEPTTGPLDLEDNITDVSDPSHSPEIVDQHDVLGSSSIRGNHEDLSTDSGGNGHEQVTEDSEAEPQELVSNTKEIKPFSSVNGANNDGKELDNSRKQPRHLTQAEENRKAKLLAMQWAETGIDDFDDGSNTSSESGGEIPATLPVEPQPQKPPTLWAPTNNRFGKATSSAKRGPRRSNR
ncbi:hypothetical protein FQN54_007321 [Arachnomyces sp. PD_36]|nr:hypothetical protein FQN54_007321 [Arachnomyces sp. PD_36]